MHRELKNVILEQSMCMETRNSKTEMPLFKVKDEKFIFAVQMKLQDKCRACEGKMIFDDVLEIKNGRNQKNVENPNGKYPIYGSGGIMGYADDYICEADTVIIGRKGSINNPIYVEEPFWNVDTAFGLSAKREILMPRYLYYFCQYFDFERLNKAVTIPSLTKSDLLKIELELPTIETQKKIVDRLIKVEQIIQLKKRKLQKLDTLVKSRFAEMFGDPIMNPKGWKVVTIGDIVTEVRYGTSKPAVEGGKYPYLRMNNLTADGHLDLNDLKYIDISDDEVEKCVVRKGDVLFNRTNSIDLVGKTAVFDLPDDMVIAGYIIRVRLNEKILPEVLSQYMNLEALKDILRSMAKGAVNQANINAQELQSIRVYVPDIELQKQFVEMKDQVDKSKSKIQKSLEETQLLFDSLMQKYFG